MKYIVMLSFFLSFLSFAQPIHQPITPQNGPDVVLQPSDNGKIKANSDLSVQGDITFKVEGEEVSLSQFYKVFKSHKTNSFDKFQESRNNVEKVKAKVAEEVTRIENQNLVQRNAIDEQTRKHLALAKRVNSNLATIKAHRNALGAGAIITKEYKCTKGRTCSTSCPKNHRIVAHSCNMLQNDSNSGNSLEASIVIANIGRRPGVAFWRVSCRSTHNIEGTIVTTAYCAKEAMY